MARSYRHSNNYQFTGIETLVGGTGADQFTVEAAGSLSGTLHASGGFDSLVLASRPAPVSVSVNERRVAGVINEFSGIDQVEAQGSLINQLTSGAANTGWVIDANGQILTRSVVYKGFKSIQSGNGNDVLTGPASATSWQITAANSGQVSGSNFSYQFSGVESLIGGVDVDQFTVDTNGSLSGYVNGGSLAVNSISYANWTNGVTVNLATTTPGNATAIGGVLANVGIVLGGSGDDALTGNLLRSNALIGGNGNDQLVGGTVRDLLIGGLGSDTLRGGAGEDILIAGRTSHDASIEAWLALQSEWTNTTRNFAARVSNLRGVTNTGLNGNTYLQIDSVFGDSNAVDSLTAMLVPPRRMTARTGSGQRLPT